MKSVFWILYIYLSFWESPPLLAYPQLVKDGYADLSAWSRTQDPENIYLTGHWEFYWQELRSSFDIKHEKISYMNIPSSWTQQYESFGFATYRARVQVDENKEYGLYIPDITTAAQLTVNGEVIWKAGEIATSPSQSQPFRRKGIIQLPKGSTYDFVFWVSNYEHVNGGIKEPLRFGLHKSLTAEYQRRILLDALVTAAILAIGIYHLVISMIRKDILPLLLALLCITMSLRSGMTGMRFLDHFFELPLLLSYKLEYASAYLIPTFGEAFILALFYADYPRKIIPLRIVCHLIAIAMLFFPLYQMSRMIWLTNLHSLIVIIVCFMVSLKAVRHSRVGSAWLLKGGIFFGAIGIADIIQSQLDVRTFAYLLPIGFLGFTLSFSASIAHIYNNIYLTMLDAQEKKRHTLEQLKKIVYPHQIELIKLGHPIEATMPTGRSEACVISFDIIESSHLPAEFAKALFRNVFTRCNEVMMKGYDGMDMRAQGYRIKEMGDGFLCSVGFPFKSMSEHITHDALQLSLQFLDIFHEEAQRLQYPEILSCGIGLAIDAVEGFYPTSGAKEYDLYGKGIVLATRYEAMRKAIFEKEEKRSIIILQECVYQSLTIAEKREFKMFDLKEKGTTVRDDPNANRLYYSQFSYPSLNKVAS